MIPQRTLVMLVLLLTLLGATLLHTSTVVAEPHGVASPEVGPPGTLFTFTAHGFESNEQIGAWVVGPDGRTFNVEIGGRAIVANSQGDVTWTWQAPDFTPAGLYHMHARGSERRITIQIPFTIEGTEEQPAGPPGDQSSWMVIPERGPPGTIFTFVARSTGFIPGEQVGSWLIQPDGETMHVDEGQSVDPNGQIFRLWMAPLHAAGGNWIFRARGISSGFQVDIHFIIDSDEVIPTPTPIPRFVEPTSGPHGTTFTFTAGGFSGNELLSTWVEDPNGHSRDGAPRVYADATGLAVWQWMVPDFVPAGTWRMMIRGTRTHQEQFIFFEVTGESSPPPTATAIPAPPEPAPTMIPTPLTLPTPHSAPNTEAGGMVANSQGGAPGTIFSFSAYGFLPGEYIFFWATDPNGLPIHNTEELRADDAGRVWWSWQVPSDAVPGQWEMAARGKVSSVRVQIPFMVTPIGVPERTSVEPAVGAPGETFRFTASGFVSKEYVNIWAVSPQGEHFDGPTRQRADRDGFIEWTWQAPQDAIGGVWQMYIRGVAISSRVEYIIPFVIERTIPLNPGGRMSGVSPASGPPGTTFTFHAKFFPNQGVSYWLNAPDGSVISSDVDENDPHQARVVANDDGHATVEWTSPPDAMRGHWTMVMRNATPHHERRDRDVTHIIPFVIE